MKLSTQIIISDGVSQNPVEGSNNVIQNPTLMIQLPFMPSAASMTLSVVIGVFDDEKQNDFTISTKIIHTETGEVIFHMEPNKIGPFPQRLIKSNLVLNTDLRNIPVRREGEYLAEVTINGEKFEQKFYIVKMASDQFNHE